MKAFHYLSPRNASAVRFSNLFCSIESERSLFWEEKQPGGREDISLTEKSTWETQPNQTEEG